MPAKFDACVAKNGKVVVTKSIGKDKYVHGCTLDGKNYVWGEVKTKKTTMIKLRSKIKITELPSSKIPANLEKLLDDFAEEINELFFIDPSMFNDKACGTEVEVRWLLRKDRSCGH